MLFIGAGASRDVGLPDWRGLLEAFSQRLCNYADREGLSTMDPRDHATLIEKELGRAELLTQLVSKLGGGGRPIGLTHALLASLDARQAITTNYDDLYERAWTAPGQAVEEAVTVLPYGRVQEDRPWVLKLHGSLRDGAKDIVLTRSDYLRLRHQRGALYGIVQALLVTKHLLFVGYSLSDEDFHELVDEIRTALEPTTGAPPRLGTVLTIHDSAWASLWDDLLNVVHIADGPEDSDGRRLQIFLDCVAHHATPQHAYLLDKSFGGLLTEYETAIAESLQSVEALVAESTQPTAVAVREALRAFGGSSSNRGTSQ